MKKLTKTSMAFLVVMCFCFAQCKKHKTPVNTVDQLPPATQTGANTFGCLINGQVFVPKGSTNMGKPNYRVMVDPTYNDGQFSVNCYAVINANDIRFLDFGSDSIKSVGIYALTSKGRLRVAWSGGNCSTSVYDTISYKRGYLKITRYDLSNSVFSGEFEFFYKPPTCDTIKITSGRFDYKF